MPTSNGQVNTWDIRREAVVETTIRDEAVTTGKIPDLAVTFPDKIDDPIWSTTFESEPGINPTLDTTPQEVASIDIAVPAWVDSVEVFAAGQWQMTSSATHDLIVSTRVEDQDDGARQASIPSGSNGLVTHFEDKSLIGVAGATFQVSAYVWVSSGTNSANSGAVWGMVVGRR